MPRINERPRRSILLEAKMKIATRQQRRHGFRFSQRGNVALFNWSR